MSGIRTNAAAELLGVSPNTLRSWERRFGYPKPRRTAGGHRQYDLAELEALRRALLETHNISSAIEVARQRGEGPTSRGPPCRGLRPLRRHARRPRDGGEPRRPLRGALGGGPDAARARARARPRRSRGRVRARLPLGDRLAARRSPRGAVGHSLPRASCSSTRATRLDLESLHVQALELALRRAGFRVLLLSMSLAAGAPVARHARARSVAPSSSAAAAPRSTWSAGSSTRCATPAPRRGCSSTARRCRSPATTPSRRIGSTPIEATSNMKAIVDGRRDRMCRKSLPSRARPARRAPAQQQSDRPPAA